MQRLVGTDSSHDPSSHPLDQWRHLPPRLRHQKAVQFQQQRLFQSELRTGTLLSATPSSSSAAVVVSPKDDNSTTASSSAIHRSINAVRAFIKGAGGGGGKRNWKGLAAAGVAVLLFAIWVVLRRSVGQQRKLVESVLQRGVAAVGGGGGSSSVSQVTTRGPRLDI